MGIFSSHESFIHDVEIRRCDFFDVEPDGITFADNSYLRNFTFIDDKREKFYELIKNASEKEINIYLRCHENVIYGVLDDNKMWHMSGRLAPMSYGWDLIGN